MTGIAEGRLLIDYDDGDREAITPSLCERLDVDAPPPAGVPSLSGGR